ncbi:LysM peptidoglycan-binding domain-containing protein [Hyalangium versicolor]|uniref:LysM peptidoglycan-binding domain-containing protein n=1 Tax=Hyalangium versicolor TaxID=2861190 RepID=UPI0040391AE2
MAAIARRHGVSVEAIARRNGISDVNRIWAGQVVWIPRAAPPQQSAPQQPATYRVRAGDTLFAIAQRHNVDLDALVSANGIQNPDLIRVGQVLTLPVAAGVVQGKPRVEPAPQVRSTEDLIEKARKLNGEYIALRQRYMEWIANPEEAAWYCIAQWTQALVKVDAEEYGPLVNAVSLKAFLKNHESQEQQRRLAYEAKGRELAALLALPAFKQQFDALGGSSRVQVYVDVTNGLSQCDAGRAFILRELKAAEENNPIGMLQGVFKVLKEANGLFWTLLGELAPVIVKWKQEKALAYVETLIVQRITIVVVDHLHQSLTIYDKTIFKIKRKPIQVTVLSPEAIRLPDTPAFKGANALMQKAFAVFNFAFALRDASQQLGPKETLSLMGAMAGLMEQISVVTRALQAKSLVRAAGKAVEVTVLGIIGGVCDTIAGSLETWDYYSKGDFDAAVVSGVGTVAGLAVTVGLSMMYFGAGTSWSGVGLVIAIVGGVIALIAAIVSFFGDLADSPLELWLKNSRFGIQGNAPAKAFQSWKDKSSVQIDELLKVLCVVEASGDFKGDEYRITLKPSLLLTCSRMVIVVTTLIDGKRKAQQIPVTDASLDGDRVTEVRFGISWPSRPTDWLKAAEEVLPGGLVTYAMAPKVIVAVAVDLYGDGVMKYQRAVTLNPLWVERALSFQAPPEEVLKAVGGPSGFADLLEKPLLAMGPGTQAATTSSSGVA